MRRQLVLPLHNDEEAVHADDKEYGNPFQDKKPVKHDGRSAEFTPEAPVGASHCDGSEGHAEKRQHYVRKGQGGEEEIDG